jgi:DNA repair photolyase
MIERLSGAGIPVRVMIAPLIPVLNEHEIETLLQAARSAGARAADYVLLRLPHEVAPLFRDWLDRHHPDAAQRIMQHIQDTRAGRDNDSTFGRRMRGSGHYADLIRQRFRLAIRRLGFDAGPALRVDLFRPPHVHGQLGLF